MNATSPVSKGNQFLHSLKSEWTKMASVRRTWVWIVLFLGSVVGPVTLMTMFNPRNTVEYTWPDLIMGSGIFMLLAVVFGASSTAQEFNSKMNAHAFLTQKGRWHWLSARFLILGVLMVALWYAGIGIAWLIATVWPGASFVGGSFTGIWANGVAMPVYALIGAGVAALTRSRVAGLTLPLVWMLVIENILFGFRSRYEWVDFLYRWSPGHSVQDITLLEQGMPFDDSVTVSHALTVLAVWAVIAVAVGLIANQKRDVN